ncbi:hypothetical protein GA0070609_0933 [Micromonospora echinaurantiaca]|uniref:4-amino-4-deoxy-L-arabinose transferase n=1 Tax=Micromonospora echinaurantiaca TaxID=47857 RepID=A0A1C5H415_9ACTN|nr:hypothetical protein [Micromonospora echinaurantiaca]SCG40785.1 hypothetical protein GA0070609_0933 [Micromonospora echinaurantiaca]
MTTGVRQQRRAAPCALPGTRWTRLAGPLTVAAIVAGVGYRLWLLLHDTPPTNSDEATMGLAALHIAQGRQFPVWFYGQEYMGPLEAYLAAPVFALAGPSVLGLRLPTLALYALFVLLAWRLTLRLTGDRWFALLVVALLALGSDRIVKNQLIAGGGYPEMNPAGMALALLAYDLAAGRPGRRLPRWAAWGFLAGLMAWVDPLVLPYVAATGAVLLGFRWGELRGPAGALLGLAAALGAAPLLGHSLLTGRNPLAAVLAAGGGDQSAGWADRLHGALVLGPPLGMGFCSPSHCATWQLWWAAALPVLLAAAGVTAWRTLRTLGAEPAAPGGPPAAARSGAARSAFGAGSNRPAGLGLGGTDAPGERRRCDADGDPRVGAAIRLALVLGGVATLAVYAVSSAAGRTPVESSRYLSCLLISLPALLWPLWTAARGAGWGAGAGRDVSGSAGSGRRAGVLRVAAVGVLAATAGTAVVATAGAIGTAPAAQAAEARHTALVAALRERGVRHVYAGYWTCNRLTFASAEDVVCAVIDDDLSPGHDRYLPYRRAVRQAAAPAWVAPVGSPLATRLDDRTRAEPGRLTPVTIDGWRIYLPHP